MVKFVGMVCVTLLLAEEIEKQLKEKAMCYACWSAFVTLSNSCFKEKGLMKDQERHLKIVRKLGEAHWKRPVVSK